MTICKVHCVIRSIIDLYLVRSFLVKISNSLLVFIMTTNSNECSSRRDRPLAQELANKLSIVANPSSVIHKNHTLDEQEQVSPLGRDDIRR